MIKLLSLADGITLLNAIFGFIAILAIFSDQVRISFSLIFLAILADGLDGIVARKTGKGKIGDYLEAMADMTSLSIAPMIFIYKTYYSSIVVDLLVHILFVVILVVFVICSIIRLSSFHIMKHETFFVGFPASAGTIFLVILSIIKIDLLYILLFVILVSLAMISPIRFPKLRGKINAIAAILILLAIILWDMFNYIAVIVLFVALTVYVVAGPLYLRKHTV